MRRISSLVFLLSLFLPSLASAASPWLRPWISVASASPEIVAIENQKKTLFAEKALLQKQFVLNKIRINEAWPPEVEHDAPCHYTGCAIDFSINDSATKKWFKNKFEAYYKTNDSKNIYPFCYILDEGLLPSSKTSGSHFHIESWLKMIRGKFPFGDFSVCGL